MAVRPHPHRAVGDINVARHRVRRRHAAPADAAGEARHIGAEQTVAHHRVNAVGADHDVGLDLAAVGKARYGVLGAALDRHGAHAGADLGGLERAGEDRQQVGAVHRQIGRAEFFFEVAAPRARDVAATVPGADVEKVGIAGDGVDLVLDAERAQRLDGIGRGVEPGADLAQIRRLLAHDGLGAAMLQRQRRGEPADPASHDGNARCAWHQASSTFGSAVWIAGSGPAMTRQGAFRRRARRSKRSVTAPSTIMKPLISRWSRRCAQCAPM